MKRAIIVGCNGQDGRILYEFLLEKNYKLLGIARDMVRSTEPGWTEPIDIKEQNNVSNVVYSFNPDEIYYLAAFHHSSEDVWSDDVQLFTESFEVNTLSLINFLDSMKKCAGNTKLFYAASSYMFGTPPEGVQNQTASFNPNSIYGISKTAGVYSCRFYRDNYEIFASVGILYNHESPLRAPKFVSRKIIRAAIAIKNKHQDNLVIADLNAKADWGYAPDYVEAMHTILQLDSPGDFIVSTGATHTVLDFIEEVFGHLDLDWKKYVVENPDLVKRNNKHNRQRNIQNLRSVTAWRPKVGFKELIRIMVREESRSDGNE